MTKRENHSAIPAAPQQGGCLCHSVASFAGQQVSRRLFGRGLVATAGLAAIAGCSTNPATGRSNFGSIRDDISVGQENHDQIVAQFGGEYRNKKVQDYVSDVGLTLARLTEFPNLPYRFTVLNSPIVNAFALPGGYIYMSRGLLALANSEAEMASVLGHEIGHVIARHGSERQTQGTIAQLGLAVLGIATGSQELVQVAGMGAQAYLQSYSRDQEFEADSLGVRYMAVAGYDPEASANFLASLRDYSRFESELAGRDPNQVDEFNWLASHPRTIERVERAIQEAAVEAPADPVVGRNRYLTNINGMLFGEDPKQGIIEGRRFVHPDLRFEFTVPQGFRLQNSPSQVAASNGRTATILFDIGRGSGDLARYMTQQWLRQVRVQNVQRETVNGRDAATGVARVQSNNGQADLRALVIDGPGDTIYRFMILTQTGQLGRVQSALYQTVDSFRILSAAQASQIRAYRIKLHQVRGGDTVSKLARTYPYGRFNDKAFELYNDISDAGDLDRGQYVKLVAT